MKDYKEEDYLPLSGIQHYQYCKRQWALIHIEQQWTDNAFTIKGNYMHQKVDNAYIKEKRKEEIISRGMPIHSRELGINGICDVVEFHKSDKGTYIKELGTKYDIIPIEYKRGRPKEHNADILQVVAQSMCLEEMLCTKIDKAYIFYGEIKHRIEVDISAELRKEVEKTCNEMHEYFSKSYTPKCKKSRKCDNCSLYEICAPNIFEYASVSDYISSMLGE